MLRTRRGGRRRAVIGRSRPSFGWSRSRLSESPSSAVPLGTPTGVLQSLKGVGDGPNFLRGQAKKWRGLAKGAQPSWLRSLLTFCRITESRSLRGSSGGEEKVIFSPRGLGLRKQAGCRPAGQLRPCGPRAPPPPRAGRRNSSVLVAFPAGGDSLFLRRQTRLACPAAPLFLEATQLVGARCVPRRRQPAFSRPTGPVGVPSGTWRQRNGKPYAR